MVGTDRRIPLLELAERARGSDLSDELAGGLDAAGRFVAAGMSFPNGCHVCEVEVDPETGALAVVGYAAVGPWGGGRQPAQHQAV
jgi:aerobic carbon-monoxide dehydrogenase large subunit